MSEFKLTTPIAFLIFNRPDTTARVFAEIRKARPTKLLIVADGPRPGRSEEEEKCKQVRAIIEGVDWECEVLKNYSDVNLGCKRRVSSGLDWVFETVEEAIILEDDCLPHPTFFRFCQELLERYRDDERIGMISGSNFYFGENRTEYSYYFSRYNLIWGWASWRRAWKYYDVHMKLWPEIRDSKWLYDCVGDKTTVDYWGKIFERVYQGEIDTWDYQLVFTCWIQSKFSILPNVNLVSNIGFGPGATHTMTITKVSNMPALSIGFPLKHPDFIIRDASADNFIQQNHFSPSIKVRIRSKLAKIFRYLRVQKQ